MADSQIAPERVCTKCNRSLPATTEYFFAARLGAGGLKSVCKPCAQGYNRQWAKTARARDPNPFQKRAKRHRARHGDEYREQQREWSKAHREKWREFLRAYHAEWSSQHVDKVRRKRVVSEGKRRAAKRGAGGTYSAQDVADLLSTQGGLCFYCGDILTDFHVDHFIPLSKGGNNTSANLRLACRPCNLSKGSKLPWEWKPQQFSKPVGD